MYLVVIVRYLLNYLPKLIEGNLQDSVIFAKLLFPADSRKDPNPALKSVNFRSTLQ